MLEVTQNSAAEAKERVQIDHQREVTVTCHMSQRPVRTGQDQSWPVLHFPEILRTGIVTITVWTPALCLLDMSDKSFSLCLPYSSLTLCLIRTDNPTSLSIPSFVRPPCSTYDSFLITNTVVTFVH